MKTDAQIAKAVVRQAFKGRTGHGGTPSIYRQMSPPELETWILAALKVAAKRGAR